MSLAAKANPDGTVSILRPPKIKNTTGLHPTADKILVEPVTVEEKTSGGIVLASQSLDKEQLAQTIGTVIAVGNSAHLCPEMTGIEVGDQVLFARYSGSEFPVGGVSYRIMRARDVIGKATKLPDSVIRGALSSVEAFGFNANVETQ